MTAQVLPLHDKVGSALARNRLRFASQEAPQSVAEQGAFACPSARRDGSAVLRGAADTGLAVSFGLGQPLFIPHPPYPQAAVSPAGDPPPLDAGRATYSGSPSSQGTYRGASENQPDLNGGSRGRSEARSGNSAGRERDRGTIPIPKLSDFAGGVALAVLLIALLHLPLIGG